MIRPLSEVARDAIELPQEQRLTLARILIDCSDGPSDPSPDVEAAWEVEISRRIRTIDSGETQGIPLDEVLQELDSRFGK